MATHVSLVNFTEGVQGAGEEAWRDCEGDKTRQDLALEFSLAPGQRRTDSFRRWVETHEDALFLPAASIVEIKAAIKSIPASRAIRADALDKRLDGLVATFSDVIHPVDVKVATRTGEIMERRRSCSGGFFRRDAHPPFRYVRARRRLRDTDRENVESFPRLPPIRTRPDAAATSLCRGRRRSDRQGDTEHPLSRSRAKRASVAPDRTKRAAP